MKEMEEERDRRAEALEEEKAQEEKVCLDVGWCTMCVAGGCTTAAHTPVHLCPVSEDSTLQPRTASHVLEGAPPSRMCWKEPHRLCAAVMRWKDVPADIRLKECPS